MRTDHHLPQVLLQFEFLVHFIQLFPPDTAVLKHASVFLDVCLVSLVVRMAMPPESQIFNPPSGINKSPATYP